jgi:GH25 family lysozyme M1 (1,4-beta-N-acetylmuramidase)
MSEKYLFVDLYSDDLDGKPNWPAVFADSNFTGAIIKATESVAFDTSWFTKNWPALKTGPAERYADTWFRGAYHFLKFNVNGSDQADFYLRTIENAGGFDSGDIIPIVDVELGNDGKPDANGRKHKRNSNWDASAQQIIDCTSEWVERVKSQTGQEVMLYGNGAMRDKGIRDRMGCDWLWIARWTSTLPRIIYERIGWDLESIALWQYCGDGEAVLPNFPRSIAGFGKVDISAGLFPTLGDFHNRCCGQIVRS